MAKASGGGAKTGQSPTKGGSIPKPITDPLAIFKGFSNKNFIYSS